MLDFVQKIDNITKMKIWSHDRKPLSLDDMIGNQPVCDLFRSYMQQNNIPNVILSGDNGTCKRTIAHLVAKEYLKEHYTRACLEIDGAINRGKDVISCGNNNNTSKQAMVSGPNVMSFSKTQVALPQGKKKIIIIYNFNDMTIEAQNALRRIMEKCANTTRFILICNRHEDIIEAIQSRCCQLKTIGLSYEQSSCLVDKLGLNNIDPKIKNLIIMLSDGDCKRLVNYAQVVNGGGKREQPLTMDEFYNLFNIPPIKIIEQILIDIYKKIDVYERIKKHLVEQGHAYSDLIDIITKILVFNNLAVVPDSVRHQWIISISEKYSKQTQNMSRLQIYALFADLYLKT